MPTAGATGAPMYCLCDQGHKTRLWTRGEGESKIGAAQRASVSGAESRAAVAGGNAKKYTANKRGYENYDGGKVGRDGVQRGSCRGST